MGTRGHWGFCTIAILLALVGNGLGIGQVPLSKTAVKPGNAAGETTIRDARTPRGAGSCSATACHGSAQPSPNRILRNEHLTWITKDKHAEAYNVLHNARSASIARNLPGSGLPAYKDARCLACHTTPVVGQAPEANAILISDGVGCESCHGASDRWIGEHTRRDWAGRTVLEKERSGMVFVDDLVRRAKVCAECHIGLPARDGTPARDVNHDMIAAGHPRLNFEFSAFFEDMPHHWRDAVDPSGSREVGPDATSDFSARSWAIGQVVSAQASLNLLSDRSRQALAEKIHGEPTRWPEFTE